MRNGRTAIALALLAVWAFAGAAPIAGAICEVAPTCGDAGRTMTRQCPSSRSAAMACCAPSPESPTAAPLRGGGGQPTQVDLALVDDFRSPQLELGDVSLPQYQGHGPPLYERFSTLLI